MPNNLDLLEHAAPETLDEVLGREREDRRAFLVNRQKSGVGSSQIWRILSGEALDVYHQLTRPITDEDVDRGRESWDLTCGILLEPIAAALFFRTTGRVGRREYRQFTHPDYPGASTSADGTIYADSPNLPEWAEGTGGLELKAPRSSVVYDMMQYGVRDSILYQLQHSLAVRRLSWGSYGFFSREHPYIPIDIQADPVVGTFLLEVSARFWAECVVPRVPPDPEKWAALLDKAPTVTEGAKAGELVTLDPELDAEAITFARNYAEASAALKQVEEIKKGASKALAEWLAGRFPNDGKFEAPGFGKITRVTTNGSSFNREALAGHRPIDRDALVRFLRDGNWGYSAAEVEALADSLALDLARFDKPYQSSYLRITPRKGDK